MKTCLKLKAQTLRPIPRKISKGAFKQTAIRLFPMFGEPRELDVPVAEGGHGAASVLVGIAANMSIESGELVDVGELFELAAG